MSTLAFVLLLIGAVVAIYAGLRRRHALSACAGGGWWSARRRNSSRT